MGQFKLPRAVVSNYSSDLGVVNWLHLTQDLAFSLTFKNINTLEENLVAFSPLFLSFLKID